MKQVTQQLFHAYFTFQPAKIESFVADNLDPIGKNLLYILHANHIIQLKSNPTPPQIKAHLDQYFYPQIQSGFWQKDDDFTILLLALLLGKKDWKDKTQFYISKLSNYLSSDFIQRYLNQPAIKARLLSITDLKSNLTFISIFKGIYYYLLNEDALAKKYLQDVDAMHQGIAQYYGLLLGLKQKQVDIVKVATQRLQQDKVYGPWMTPFEASIQEMLKTFERPNFFQEMEKLNHPQEIDRYMINAFSKQIFDAMHEDTRKMMQAGFYITAKMTKLFAEGKIDDFSTFALPFVKAFELECYRLFKRDYLRFLKKEGITPYQAIPRYLKQGDVEGLVIKQGNHYAYDEEGLNRFSIGQIPFVVGIPSHFLDPDNPEYANLPAAMIHPTFQQYWQKRMQKKPKFQSDRSIKDVVKNTFLIKRIRNQIAHAEIITWKQLTEIVELIFESGQIRELIEMNGA